MKKFSILIIVLLLTTFAVQAQEYALVKTKKKFGYINKKGEEVIEPQFYSAGWFSGKYAAAMDKSKKWGYIDTKGKWVIEPQYKVASGFISGVALVNDSEWKYINYKNEVIKVPEADKYHEFQENGLAIVIKDKKVGIIRTNGTKLIDFKYDVIKPFVNGKARVRLDSKWGLIDENGKEYISPKYNDISEYSKNGVWARTDDGYGVIVNKSFKLVNGCEKIWDFTNMSNLAYAKKDGKIGFINSSGKWVIEPAYDKARAFNLGMAPVFKDKKWGYINEKGDVVIELKYGDAEVFSDDGLAAVREGKPWGFINKKGELVIPMEYEISFGVLAWFTSGFDKGFKDGVVRVRKKKKFFFIDTENNMVGKEYDYVNEFIKIK